MIISVSRRTDIPSFYGEWFMNCISKQEVTVTNPMNKKQKSIISLKPEDVECFVFWTKDPEPLIKYLDKLDNLGYYYYFLFTLNPYNITIEKNLRSKDELIKTFKNLAKKIGKEKVIWRYDPIIINKELDIDYHIKEFTYLAKNLKDSTNKCIISFLELYTEAELIADSISKIAHRNNIEVVSCAQNINLEKYKIAKSKCIDNDLISQITGKTVKYKKDSGQRKHCNCSISRDIGMYNSCLHHCTYCYANKNSKSIERNFLKNYYNLNAINLSKKYNRTTPAYLNRIKELSTKNSFILDFGSGSGRDLNWLHQYFVNCYGLELSEKMIEYCFKNFPNLNNKIFQGYLPDNIDDFILKNKWDIILCSSVLQHLNDKNFDLSIKIFSKLLNTGGKIIISIPEAYPGIINNRDTSNRQFIVRNKEYIEEVITNNKLNIINSYIDPDSLNRNKTLWQTYIIEK